MQLFEEPIGSLFTDGPAVVLKVEQRRQQRVRSQWDTRGVEWEDYGVVIYTAKAKAAPVPGPGGHYTMPESAIETRFIRVPDLNGGCVIPEGAGRLLGHYRQDGQRWWVFLEKVGVEAPERPGSAARPKSGAQSPPGKAAPSGRVSPPGQPSPRPSSQQSGSPGSTSVPGGR